MCVREDDAQVRCRRGEIYWASLNNEAAGSEQKGYRPVIVVQNNVGNYYSSTVIVAPLTTQLEKLKKCLPVHVLLKAADTGLPRDSFAMMEQLTTISKDRLGKYIGCATSQTMALIDRAIEVSVF